MKIRYIFHIFIANFYQSLEELYHLLEGYFNISQIILESKFGIKIRLEDAILCLNGKICWGSLSLASSLYMPSHFFQVYRYLFGLFYAFFFVLYSVLVFFHRFCFILLFNRLVDLFQMFGCAQNFMKLFLSRKCFEFQ